MSIRVLLQSKISFVVFVYHLTLPLASRFFVGDRS